MSEDAQLHARPASGPAGSDAKEKPGLQPLAVPGAKPGRDSYLYLPAGYAPGKPCLLALMLHGAGGHAHQGIGLLQHLADDANTIIVAPASRAPTWDIIAMGRYGPDVDMIDGVLDGVFRRFAADRSHVAIGGFSDGASYALSLGLANGELFTHVIAFSPGFIAPAAVRGKPRIFISHGTQDHVLPIAACSRKIVPRLRKAGYDVVYQEFEGGHVIPADVSRQAMRWFSA